MARAYSGVLGALALSFTISRGLVLGFQPDEILSQALVTYFLFAFTGFWIGFAAEKTVCESVESRFRSEIARLTPAVTESSE